jgi:hypothetical protein
MAIIRSKNKGESTDVAERVNKTTAVAVRGADPFADAGQGTENVSAGDLIIPRLTILHEMSKITKKNRPEYIKGAMGGMFCVPALQLLFDGEEGIYVIPILYQRRLIEWTPQDAGGGLVRMDVPEDELEGMERKNPGVYLTENDTEVVVTPEYYLLICDLTTGDAIPCVTSMTGKKAQASKRWNTLIMSQRRVNPKTGEEVQMPFWFNMYHMTAVADSNDKGDFYIPAISVFTETLLAEHGDRFYRRAREFYNSVKVGAVKAADIDER